MNRKDKNLWGWNVCQKLEAMCMDLDGFVCKEPVFYIGNQMQSVGETVKKLYADVMQDFLLSPLDDPAQLLPTSCVDLVETSETCAVKEDSVDSVIIKSKEAPVVPETCYKTSTSSAIRSEQMTEYGNLIDSDNTYQENNAVEKFPCEDVKRDNDHSAKISGESSENDMSKHEDITCDASSQNDDSESENGFIELNLGTEEKIKVELLMNLKDKCDEEPSAYKISCESPKNEDILCNASSQCDDSEFEDCWSLSDILDDMSDPEDKICSSCAQSDDSEYENGWGEALNIELNLDTEENNDHSVNMSLESSPNRLDERIKLEGMLCYASSQSDASECEDGWGETDITELNLDTEEKIEVEPLMNLNEKCDDDHSAKMSCEFSENHFEDIFKQEGILSDASSQSDASEFEDESIKNVIDMNLGEFSENHFEDIIKQEGIPSDASSQSDASEFEDEGIKNVIDMNLGPEEKIDVEPLLNDALAFEDADCGITNIIDLNLDTEDKKVKPLEEKKTLENCSIDEFDCDSSTHQTSKLEISVNRNENKEENGCQTKSVGDFSVSSFGLSSCDSNYFSASFTSSSYYAVSNDGSSTAYSEDVKLGTIDMSNGKKLDESSVIAVGGKLTDFPAKAGKSKSYKKMIQDVFMSRKRLAKEYKQLAVLYGDIDNESTEEKKLPTMDSEWELL